jgi:transcriptional regulator with XRE-family HTH domain
MGGKKREITGEDRAIGARIRIQRQRLGVSVSELGLAFGGSRQKVQFWERGENFPPVSDFSRLCHLLRTDPNYIILGAPATDLTEKEIRAARLEIQSAATSARTEPSSGRLLHQRHKKRA